VRLEQVLALEPLLLPAEDCATLEAAAVTPAFQLFMQRLSGGAGGERAEQWACEPRAFRPWLEVLRRTDGLPLAIELIASRARYLPPALALSSALKHAVTRTAAATCAYPASNNDDKHGSLFACFRSSWVALGVEARRYLTCLALINGPFDLDIALELGKAIQLNQVEATFARIQCHSLVADDLRITAARRYRVLETVRSFVEFVSEGKAFDSEISAKLSHWLWKTHQDVAKLRSRIETESCGVELLRRHTDIFFNLIEHKAIAGALTPYKLTAIRLQCFFVQVKVDPHFARTSLLSALDSREQLSVYQQAAVYYNLARAHARLGETSVAATLFETAEAFGVDDDPDVSKCRLWASLEMTMTSESSPAVIISITTEFLLALARKRLSMYCEIKNECAYLLVAFGNAPALAVKHMTPLVSGWLKKFRAREMLRDNLLFAISMFALSPNDHTWRQMCDAQCHLHSKGTLEAVNWRAKYVCALAEIVSFHFGFPPLLPQIWQHHSTNASASRAYLVSDEVLVLTASACVSARLGYAAIVAELTLKLNGALIRTPLHPDSLIAKVIHTLQQEVR
ncbi:MAG: hypothetical protein ACRCWJ_16095, partial [Casimicrobium sp.]